MLLARRPSRLRASLRAEGNALAASREKITGLPGGQASTLRAMRGAIAAGHRLTAEAGAEILAAALVSWVAESPLTGPAAGGFLLVHRARDRSDRLLDFFVSVPGRGSKRPPEPHMESIDVDFDGSTSQVFLIGPGSCAVPGALAGLEAAHARYATLPWHRLL